VGYFLFLLRHRVLVQLKIRTTHQFDPAEEEYFTQVSFYIFLSKSPPKSAGNKSKCQTQHKSTAPSPPSERSSSSCKQATSSHHHNCNQSSLNYLYIQFDHSLLLAILTKSQQNGQPSNYIDPRYNPNPSQQFNPGAMAQQAQDPSHPANPSNPKVRTPRYRSSKVG
jgi:hypothetical protein